MPKVNNDSGDGGKATRSTPMPAERSDSRYNNSVRIPDPGGAGANNPNPGVRVVDPNPGSKIINDAWKKASGS